MKTMILPACAHTMGFPPPGQDPLATLLRAYEAIVRNAKSVARAALKRIRDYLEERNRAVAELRYQRQVLGERYEPSWLSLQRML